MAAGALWPDQWSTPWGSPPSEVSAWLSPKKQLKFLHKEDVISDYQVILTNSIEEGKTNHKRQDIFCPRQVNHEIFSNIKILVWISNFDHSIVSILMYVFFIHALLGVNLSRYPYSLMLMKFRDNGK
jgi:hypothetical protein